jgi:hypothetical protein
MIGSFSVKFRNAPNYEITARTQKLNDFFPEINCQAKKNCQNKKNNYY